MPDRDKAGGPRPLRPHRLGQPAGAAPAEEDIDSTLLLDFTAPEDGPADSSAPAAVMPAPAMPAYVMPAYVMPAYVMIEADQRDEVALAAYHRLTSEAADRHGARFLVRGGAMHVLEGDWQPRLLALLAFPDVASAQAFYASSAYARARDARAHDARLNVIIVEGEGGLEG